jgi:BASS family bile acid:Na+ symporter
LALIGFGLTASIFLAVLAVGMRITPADLRYLLSRPSLLLRSLLAMKVLAPIIAVLVCKMFSLHPAVTVALVTLAVAPVGSLFSKSMLPLVAPENAAYARGLFFASIVLSVVLTPLTVELMQVIFGGDVHVNPLSVAEVVISSVLLPLGIGLAIAQWWPAATRWNSAIQTISSVVLAACGVVLLVVVWSQLGLVIQEGTLTAIAMMTLSALAVGHLLGGPGEDDRTVLAFATVSRHRASPSSSLG